MRRQRLNATAARQDHVFFNHPPNQVIRGYGMVGGTVRTNKQKGSASEKRMSEYGETYKNISLEIFPSYNQTKL